MGYRFRACSRRKSIQQRISLHKVIIVFLSTKFLYRFQSRDMWGLYVLLNNKFLLCYNNSLLNSLLVVTKIQGLWIIRLAQLLINSSTLHARPGLPVPPPCIFAVGNKIGYITLCGRAIKQVRVQVSRISVEQLFINNWCNLLFQEHLSSDTKIQRIQRDLNQAISRFS